MRKLERALGRMRAATEGAGVKVEERMKRAAWTLSRGDYGALVARLASFLAEWGLSGDYHAVTILPSCFNPAGFLGSGVKLEALVGKRVQLVDYWAGRLKVEIEGTPLLLEKRNLLHTSLNALVASHW